MRAVYLQSVGGRGGALAGRFKLKYNYDRDMDVFSQTVREDEYESHYMEDSFCVGSDEMDELGASFRLFFYQQWYFLKIPDSMQTRSFF